MHSVAHHRIGGCCGSTAYVFGTVLAIVSGVGGNEPATYRKLNMDLNLIAVFKKACKSVDRWDIFDSPEPDARQLGSIYVPKGEKPTKAVVKFQ